MKTLTAFEFFMRPPYGTPFAYRASRCVAWRRRSGLFALAFAVALQSACSSLPAPAAGKEYRAGQRFVVVATAPPPEIHFEGFPQNKGSGALATAGQTFGACFTGIGHGSCSGSGCGAALVLLLGICSIAGVVGGVVGAVNTPGADSIDDARADMIAATTPMASQEALRQQVVTAAVMSGGLVVDLPTGTSHAALQAGDYRELAGRGIDGVLEVRLVKVGIDGDDANKALGGYMKAHARLIGTADNQERFSADFLFLGDDLPLDQWTANNGQRLLGMLKAGYESLGPQIYERVFMLYPFPDQHSHSANFFAVHYGLAPIYPLRTSFDWPAVDSLQPVLQWQAFPRDSDIKADPENMGKVRNVRYDLVVAPLGELDPIKPFYRRDGLTQTQHKLGVALQWGGQYEWTVRARFELNGEERVTEWSRYWAATSDIRGVPRTQVAPPAGIHYGFRTE